MGYQSGLDVYEWDAEFTDVWLRGSPLEDMDLINGSVARTLGTGIAAHDVRHLGPRGHQRLGDRSRGLTVIEPDISEFALVRTAPEQHERYSLAL